MPVAPSVACPLGEGVLVGTERHRAFDRTTARRALENPASYPRILASVAEHRADVAPRLVDGRGGVHLALRKRPADDVLERLLVALAKRPALRLTVV